MGVCDVGQVQIHNQRTGIKTAEKKRPGTYTQVPGRLPCAAFRQAARVYTCNRIVLYAAFSMQDAPRSTCICQPMLAILPSE